MLQLDVGTDEKIMLVARDEQSCLVVSYKDVKQCIESAFMCVGVSLLFLAKMTPYNSDLARSSSSKKQQGMAMTGYR